MTIKKYKRKTFVGTNYEILLLKQFERFKLNQKKTFCGLVEQHLRYTYVG